jgi:hypothetical protein
MRAQVSVDFIIASLVVMIIFTVIFGVYITKTDGIGDVMSNLESQRIGERIAWSMNDVSRGGDGANAEVFIPDRIWGEEYYVSIEGRWVEVTYQHGGEENRMAFPLMTNKTKGGVFMPNSRLSVVNKGGVVEVS